MCAQVKSYGVLSIMPKIHETLLGIQMERPVSVSCGRNNVVVWST